MDYTPQDAQAAITRILTQVEREHEAAYAVISQAVRICGESGMTRKETAQFLNLKARRIDKAGRYVRTPRAVRDLFRGAYRVHDYTVTPSDQDLAKRAWSQ